MSEFPTLPLTSKNSKLLSKLIFDIFHKWQNNSDSGNLIGINKSSLENLEHKFITCTYVDRIWKGAFTYIDKINQTDQTEDKANLIIGMFKGTQPLILSILAEVLQRIMYLSDEANYLLRPKILVKRAIELVAKREQEEEIKNQINDLLSG